IPKVIYNQTIKQALIVISSGGLGMTTIVDEQQKLLGLFTDGDLRRILDQEEYDLNQPIERVMIRNPRTCTADKLAAEALAIMERDKINGLIVVDDQSRVIGALNMHDLLRAGVA
ncbi:MAG: CBS domain-containing protein, partial [Halothiobacillus sp.]